MTARGRRRRRMSLRVAFLAVFPCLIAGCTSAGNEDAPAAESAAAVEAKMVYYAMPG